MTDKHEIVIEGAGVSAGVVTGPAFLLTREGVRMVQRTIDAGEIPREIARFEEALIATRRQIREIQRKVGRAIDQRNAGIFEAHLLVMDDRAFVEEVMRGLQATRRNVEAVIEDVAERYADALARMDDEYLRERAADVRDVARRLLLNLSGQSPVLLAALKEPCVVVASDLAPSDTATLDRRKVIGFATDLGSQTSHTAIMARAMEIPAVVGLHDASIRVSHGDRVLVDGSAGRLIVHPSEETLERYGRLNRARASIRARLEGLRDEPARTRDGYDLELAANIELPQDVDAVLRHGASGVGLFRTEFLFLRQTHVPDEAEQAAAYDAVARRLAPAPVIIRTMDIGGDKFASALKMPRELNPFMGWRAIRFCLAQPDIFRIQLRAILRASVHRNVKIMYPMISTVDEVVRAARILDEAKLELAREGVAFDEDIEVGIMIEVPSAALTAHLLAPHVRFFSIGTNDLIQYTLAVDRVNELITYLYEPTHPAILRLIRQTIEAGRDRGIWTGVCGEMAGSPLLAPLLMGLGVDELSMSPGLLPLVKGVIRAVDHLQCEALADEALSLSSASAVLDLCRRLTKEAEPDIFSLLS